MKITQTTNRLVIIGNGFDLAHGLQTNYKSFVDWYICKAFHTFCDKNSYVDPLIEIKAKYAYPPYRFTDSPKTFEESLNLIASTEYQSINFKSNFLKSILDRFSNNTWVDIERYYFSLLKMYFSNSSFTDKKGLVSKLNSEFDFLITQLAEYIKTINELIINTPKLKLERSRYNLGDIFAENENNLDTKFLNFNYSETLDIKGYARKEDIIHIHGRVADLESNPIIFGYGDETDPVYQNIEDSGENMYLEHIKSFGYFRTNNYHKLLSYIDSAVYSVHIVGHSCGLSDRVLLNEIFEHPNCQKIEIFYHIKVSGGDNFKEITQQISRHFKPHNKNIMRRRVIDKNEKNVIPQNTNAIN